jgi:hypothetical protein
MKKTENTLLCCDCNVSPTLLVDYLAGAKKTKYFLRCPVCRKETKSYVSSQTAIHNWNEMNK